MSRNEALDRVLEILVIKGMPRFTAVGTAVWIIDELEGWME